MERTYEEIETLLRSLKVYYCERNADFDTDESFYELDFLEKLGLPEEYRKEGVVLPTARDIIDTGTDHVSTVHARFYRPLHGTSREAKEQAEMLRKFDTGLFYRTKIEASISPWRICGKHANLHGMWVFEILYDPDAPEEAIPIQIRAINPKTVYPDSMDRPEFIIIEDQVSVTKARSEWPNWEPVGVDVVNTVTRLRYWDKNHRGIFLDGKSVFGKKGKEVAVIPHKYGCIPYVIGYSGLGNMDEEAKPEKRCVGLIRYLQAPLRAESFAFSVYNIVMKHHAWPITFATGPGAEAVSAIKLKFGNIYALPQGTTITDFVESPPPDVLMQHMSMTSSILSSSGAPRVVRGLGEEGIRSGVDRSIALNQARLKYDSILEQMQNSTSKVMAIATQVVEKVMPKDVRVWAHNAYEDFDVIIDRSKIKEHYTTYVEFTPTNPEDDARRHADAMNLTKAGMISADTARRHYLTGIDVDAEPAKLASERLLLNPIIEQTLAGIVSTNLQIEALKLQKMLALQAGVYEQMMAQQQQQAAMAQGQPTGEQPPEGPPGQPPQGGEFVSAPGPGGAQAVNAMKRQVPGTTHQPTQVGTEQFFAKTQQGKRKAG